MKSKTPRRVWIVNQFANAPDSPGGTRQYELAKYLQSNGIDAEIFASDFNLSQRKFLKNRNGLVLREELFGTRWNWLYASPYEKNDWRRVLNLVSFCFSLFVVGLFRFPTPDVVIGSSPQLPAAFVAYCVARLRRTRFYFEVRDLWPQVLLDLGGKTEKSLEVRVLGFLERILYKNSDAVVVLAKGSVEYVGKRGAKKDRVFFLPNSVDLQSFPTFNDRASLKDKHRIPRDTFSFLYAGAHGLANSLETLVEAAGILEKKGVSFRLFLVGDGPDKARVQEMAKDIKSVEFRDPIPKREIPELLQAMDSLVLTLRDVQVFQYGISPNKLFDYYAAALPVIVNVGGAVNEEVETNRVGYGVPPENAQALAQALERMIGTEATERREMGQRGRKLVESVYSRERVAQDLLGILERNP